MNDEQESPDSSFILSASLFPDVWLEWSCISALDSGIRDPKNGFYRAYCFRENHMKSLLLLVAIIGLTIPAFSLQPVGAEEGLKPLPKLTLTDLDAKPVKPEDLNGKLYVIDFW